MLFVIAGPSGSGKSTFIKLVLEYIGNAKVIDVDVCTQNIRNYEQDLGRNPIDFESFNQKSTKGHYSIINNYDKGNYGYNIPTDCNYKKSIYLLDYPGEYPECPELHNFQWKGILILPPSEQILMQRLTNENRENRISSAIEEYKECLEDIKNKRFDSWFIIKNQYYNDLISGIEWIRIAKCKISN